ncbi:MAG: hypothetical protein ACRDV9_05740 [Acidimicrobiia bacterium]
MKLILCGKCHDIVKLRLDQERWCACGESSGRYEADGWHAWFRGRSAVPLVIINQSFARAVVAQKMMGRLAVDGADLEFKALVIPEGHERFKRREEGENP